MEAGIARDATPQPPHPPRVASIADPALDEFARDTMLTLNASAVAIAVDSDGVITCRARAGAAAPEIGTTVERDRGLTGESVRTGAMVRCDDTRSDPRVDSGVLQQLGIGSILIVPLLRNGEACGVIEAFASSPHNFDDLHADVLAGIAGMIVARLYGQNVSAEPDWLADATPLAEEPPEEIQIPASVPEERDAPVAEPEEEPIEIPVATIGGYPVAHEEAPETRWGSRAMLAGFVALIVLIAIGVYGPRATRSDGTTQSAEPTKKAAEPAAQPDNNEELRRSAAAGDASAQLQLAHAYRDGAGIAPDAQQANAWLLTAAESGSADAEMEWAHAHEDDEPVQAYTWYVIAGQNGKRESADAIRRLTPKLTPSDIARVRLEVGRQYLSGHALRHDLVAAYVWFKLSEWGGDPDAKAEIEAVKSQLTPKQVGQAETRASDWIRRHSATTTRTDNVQPGAR